MEFIPRSAPAPSMPAAAPLDARQRAIRDYGVAAVAEALGLVEGARAHAETNAPMPLAKAA